MQIAWCNTTTLSCCLACWNCCMLMSDWRTAWPSSVLQRQATLHSQAKQSAPQRRSASSSLAERSAWQPAVIEANIPRPRRSSRSSIQRIRFRRLACCPQPRWVGEVYPFALIAYCWVAIARFAHPGSAPLYVLRAKGGLKSVNFEHLRRLMR